MSRELVGKRAGFWVSVGKIIIKPQKCDLRASSMRPYAMVLVFGVNSASVKSEPLRAIRESNSILRSHKIELKQRLSTQVCAELRTGTLAFMA